MKRYINTVFDEVEVEKDIVYAEITNFYDNLEKLVLDVYTPAGDNTQNRRALFIIHGGGFVTGNDKRQGYIVELANLFAKLGYVCVSPDYRLYKRGETQPDYMLAAKDAAEDIELARLFITSNAVRFGINSKNIAIAGGSAGGMTANAACTSSDVYKALICLWGAPKECKNPESYADTLMIHGTADKLVSYNQSKDLLQILTKNNIHAELITLEGAGHTAIDRKDEFVPRMISFLDERMD